jgi:DnaJ-class molecular chaperone
MTDYTIWVQCSACRGYGMAEHWNGEGCDIGDCYYCKGSGLERARDSKGRFIKIDVTP